MNGPNAQLLPAERQRPRPALPGLRSARMSGWAHQQLQHRTPSATKCAAVWMY